jgi:hypothetical protein
MHASELNPNPTLAVPALPVICERCKAEGTAGDDAFAGIPDILAFDPVPRRARSDGWKPEHQRAFIAALAITGSPTAAARTIGKHEFGAQTLRKARGGRSFAEAWDAAIDLAREREFARLRENLGELATNASSTLARLDPDDYEDGEAERREHEDTQNHIRNRLLVGRRLYLFEIREDPLKRSAWEILCGPVDWEKVRPARAAGQRALRHSQHAPARDDDPGRERLAGRGRRLRPGQAGGDAGGLGWYQRTGVLPDDSTERSAADAPMRVAEAARRDAKPERPTTGEAVSIDVTESKMTVQDNLVRDGSASPTCAIVNPKGPGVRFCSEGTEIKTRRNCL